jgi:hypothetical protein
MCVKKYEFNFSLRIGRSKIKKKLNLSQKILGSQSETKGRSTLTMSGKIINTIECIKTAGHFILGWKFKNFSYYSSKPQPIGWGLLLFTSVKSEVKS